MLNYPHISYFVQVVIVTTGLSVPSLPLNDRTYTVEILGLHAKANKLKTVFSRACARACVCVCAPPR